MDEKNHKNGKGYEGANDLKSGNEFSQSSLFKEEKDAKFVEKYNDTDVEFKKPAFPKETNCKYEADGFKTKNIEGQIEATNHSNRTYWAVLLLLSILSLITRLHNIELPKHVCWDETHFGKMGGWYIKRTFFFDVHPPLGKMLIGLSGVLTGYDGMFPFEKPGDEYGEDVNYVGMRIFCAVLGAALVPLCYMSTWLLCQSTIAAFFSALLILLDTGTLSLSRHILLDPILLFFIMMSTYSVLKFLSYKEHPFSVCWFYWLSMTGLFLSAAIGVKFVGLFVVLLVGFTTIMDLWRLLGIKNNTLVDLTKHFVARAACLIALPVIMYMVYFAIHFIVLNESGNGDGFYSSAFQSQLKGNRLYNVSMPEHIAYGSVVTLKQRRTGGAYLHSHWHLYPEEHPPRQQQITSYTHKDENNKWLVKPSDHDLEKVEKPQILHSGDLIRLEHVGTRRNLHSHREPAPLTKHHFQLSAYGENGTGDSNDIWMIDAPGMPIGTPIQTARSKFRLIHYYVRCAVCSGDKKLPKWGWDQLEATCNPNLKDTKNLYSVEEVEDSRMPNSSFELYSPNFWEKFIESHAVMTQGNSNLKPKEGEISSQPWQWPIDFKGQIFSGKNHRIYLLGNPVIFWGCLGVMLAFFVVYLVSAIRIQRGVQYTKVWTEYREKTFGACWWLLMGWALHYLPFWPMTRVLYFHHYFPALLFSAMMTGVTLDYLITLICVSVPDNLTITVFHTCFGLILSSIVYSFYLFHPMVYGMFGPMANEEGSQMHGLRWLSSWDL
ncbi:Protein O-mannosyl-transferase 2 [Mizuhopecten yessoensis]|uniref:Protein O-mannosyl-transferase 2 n=1 Tax=Mizuhopecten yessoensis TaxID=6573 RepID=A0A210R5U8_MIZYE|nr:Protein O-mannosyl-transferase 2 [Mizuhopecten yessoensis]